MIAFRSTAYIIFLNLLINDFHAPRQSGATCELKLLFIPGCIWCFSSLFCFMSQSTLQKHVLYWSIILTYSVAPIWLLFITQLRDVTIVTRWHALRWSSNDMYIICIFEESTILLVSATIGSYVLDFKNSYSSSNSNFSAHCRQLLVQILFQMNGGKNPKMSNTDQNGERIPLALWVFLLSNFVQVLKIPPCCDQRQLVSYCLLISRPIILHWKLHCCCLSFFSAQT